MPRAVPVHFWVLHIATRAFCHVNFLTAAALPATLRLIFRAVRSPAAP